MGRISYVMRPLFQSGVFSTTSRLPVSCCRLPSCRRLENYAPLLFSRHVTGDAKHTTDIADHSDETLIYSAPLAKKVQLLKMVTLGSSILLIPLQYACLTRHDLSAEPLLATVLGVGTVLQICTPLFVHLICTKYTSRIHYNEIEDKYTIVTYSFFATEKKLTFTVDDVEMPTIEIFCTAVVKNKSVFFDPQYFTDVAHYRRLMKYDMPIDFSVDEEKKELEETKKE